MLEIKPVAGGALKLTDVSSAVRSEYARILAHGRDDLLAVGFNAALVTVCWLLLPASITNWLFALHGALAFPFFHEMWMLGDTPATNVVGRDAVGAVAYLRDLGALGLANIVASLLRGMPAGGDMSQTADNDGASSSSPATRRCVRWSLTSAA